MLSADQGQAHLLQCITLHPSALEYLIQQAVDKFPSLSPYKADVATVAGVETRIGTPLSAVCPLEQSAQKLPYPRD